MICPDSRLAGVPVVGNPVLPWRMARSGPDGAGDGRQQGWLQSFIVRRIIQRLHRGEIAPLEAARLIRWGLRPLPANSDPYHVVPLPVVGYPALQPYKQKGSNGGNR